MSPNTNACIEYVREAINAVRPQDARRPWVIATFRVLEWMIEMEGNNLQMEHIDAALKKLSTGFCPVWCEVKTEGRRRFQHDGEVNHLSWIWLAEECERLERDRPMSNDEIRVLIKNIGIFASYFRVHGLELSPC